MSGFGWMVLVLVALFYFVPLCVAMIRHTNVGPVVTINLLAGWTVIGWIVALVLAVWPKREAQFVVVPYGGETYRKGRLVVPGVPPTPNIEISTEIPEGGKRSA